MKFEEDLKRIEENLANDGTTIKDKAAIGEETIIEGAEKTTQENAGKVVTVVENDKFAIQTRDNAFIGALSDNQAAIEMARESYSALKNQKKIGKSIEEVVKKNTQTDIEAADILVQEKQKNNKVKKAEIRNELLRLENERVYLKREQAHKLEIQRARHIRDNYEDLLLRTCRKKQKNAEGKWEFAKDENGKDIVNIPSKFKLFWLRLFDGIISTLNQTADIFGALNKNVLKGGFILLIIALLFIPPFREWLLGLIGIQLG